MATTIDKKYFAFISYKREDEAWAKWLQHKLEHYKLPTNLNGRTDLPKEIRPIFRDKSDLAGGVLADEINGALENSKYLIVICSPQAAQSEWVGKEVQTFIDLGRTDKIIPFIVGGTAHAYNPKDECFPMALRDLPAEQELLGVNINEMGRDAAAVKVVAQMFELHFDELWHRHEREKKRHRNWIITASIIGFLVMAGVAGWIWRQNWKLMENQSRFVAEKAQQLLDEGDTYTAQRLLINVLPQKLKSPNRPLTKEAEFAMIKAYYSNTFILGRHDDRVSSVNFSPDGNYVVSASDDYSVRIWDVSSGQCKIVLKDHNDKKRSVIFAVKSAVYTPDGQYIISTSWDNRIKLWEVNKGSGYTLLFGDDAVLSPNGRFLSVSDYNTIFIWDLYTGYCVDTLKGHDGYINSMAFNCDGRLMVSVDGKNIRIWNLENGLCQNILEGNNDYCAIFSLDSKNIVSGTSKGNIYVWSLNSQECTDTLIGHKDNINALAFSSDGKFIVSASDDNTVRIWDFNGKKCIDVMRRHTGSVTSAVFSQDGKYIVSSSADHTVRIWNWNINNDRSHCIDTKENYSKHDYYATLSHDGRYCAISSGLTTKIWDVASWKCKNTITGHIRKVDSYAFSPDCRHVISSLGEYIYIWDVDTGQCVDTLVGHTGGVNFASYSPDGRKILSSSWEDMTIRIWDTYSGYCIDTLFGHGHYINSASFSPDGKHIVSTSYDETVRIWDVATGLCTDTLIGHTMCVYSAFYSPDGKYIVSASWDNTARVWDAVTGKCIQRLVGHKDFVNFAVFNSDGSKIITASQDGTVRVWTVAVDKWQCVDVLEGHNDAVNSAVFGPDDIHIISASDDGTIRIWDFPPLQEFIDQTRERFKNNPLTDEERHKYYLE